MTVFDDLEARNRVHADAGVPPDPGPRPARALAVVTCMDTRIDVHRMLGLPVGDAHVLRTAGGRLTDDVLRSLTLSTHLLGVRNVALVTHTRCGLQDPEGTLPQAVREHLGRSPHPREWHTFTDPAEAVRDDVRRLLDWRDRPPGLTVAGYVLDVADGRVTRIVPPSVAPDPVGP